MKLVRHLFRRSLDQGTFNGRTHYAVRQEAADLLGLEGHREKEVV
jgi:hypothetical protein